MTRFLPLITFLFASGSGLQADWKESLTEQLKSSYALTSTGIDRLRITKPGTVFIVRKNGINGDLARDLTYQVNKVRDGEVAQSSGLLASMASKNTGHLFKPGDRLYLTKVDVKENEVLLLGISCDTYDVNVRGRPQQTRYKTALDFQFQPGQLAATDPAAVRKMIEAVLVPEADLKAAETATKSVEMGQTTEQVTQSLGKPEKIVNLGSKIIFVYKDMKVVFQDGKVSDVQ